EAKLHDVRTKLESDKVTVRKDGVKLLFALLDGQQTLQLLDSETARLWPDEQCKKLSSWPRLLRVFIDYTERELLLAASAGSGSGSGSRSKGGAGSRGGGGGGSAAAAATAATKASEAVHWLRRFVATADDVQRSGRRGNLQLWVWRLWHHVAKMVEAPGFFQSRWAPDYLALLSRHLLASPEYSRLLEPVHAHTLLTFSCGALDNLVGAHGVADSTTATVTSQAQAYLGLMTSLLMVMPGDLLDEQRLSIQASLEASARWLAKIRDTGRLASSWFSCAVQLLVTGGLDGLGTMLPQLHNAVRPLMRLAWRDDRASRLKETITRYCLLQLQLGGLVPEHESESSSGSGGSSSDGGCRSSGGGIGALAELYDMTVNDVSCGVAKWDLDPEDGSLGSLSLLQLQLLAGLFFQMQQVHSAGRLRPEHLTYGSDGAGAGDDGRSSASAMVVLDSDDDDDGGGGGGLGGRRYTAPPPAKRRRQLPPLDWLLEQCATTPSRWAPVLTALLHHHGYHLPPTFHFAALQQVLTCLRALVPFAAGTVSGSRHGANGDAAGVAAATAAAAAAMLRPQDLVTKQAGALWCLRCLEILAQQHVYGASQTHGSRFFGCGHSVSLATTASSSSVSGTATSPSGRDSLAAAVTVAAAWQDVAQFLTLRVAGRNLLVPPSQGLPNLLQAEALWALTAVLQLRRAAAASVGGGVRSYIVRPPAGLLQTLAAVMQASIPTDDVDPAASGGSRTPQTGVAAAATSPVARSFVWQAAAAAVVAALNAAPAADAAGAVACKAAAVSCQTAVLRLAITPPNELLHELLGATSGASYTAVNAARDANATPDLPPPPPLPPLPLDLAPEQYPHPYTRLPRWGPNDSETTAFCTNVLAVQRRAGDVMAWQEAREHAFRYLTHGSVAGPGSVATVAGAEALAAGRRVMG
ncbi:hypothetical protein VaNZ11_009904, partial [Volvox africanus]